MGGGDYYDDQTTENKRVGMEQKGEKRNAY
jgi:hypothetical protein